MVQEGYGLDVISDGDNGILSRKHVIIDNIEYIGKESNNLEETEIMGVSDNDFVIYSDDKDNNKTNDKIKHFIENMTNEQAKRIGISRSNLFYLKEKVGKGEKIRLKKKTIRKLMLL